MVRHAAVWRCGLTLTAMYRCRSEGPIAMSEPVSDGYDKVADALGMNRPRPKLRVVKPDERADHENNGVWRPAGLDDYVGQERAQLKVKMHVQSALNRERQPGHMLLSGAPGLGKTAMAGVSGALMNEGRAEDERVAVHVVMGSTVKAEAQLAKELSKLRKGDILFIDECHRMGTPAEEMLGLAMEDGRITVPGNGKGDAITMEIPPFTLIGATTKPASLSRPLNDRFSLKVRMEYYADDELAEIVRRAAGREGVEVTDDACLAIARVGRQTPRVALGVWEQVMSYASLLKLPEVDSEVVAGALDVAGIDSMGLDERDRDYMHVVASWQGRRAGLEPIAARSGLDKAEISKDVEPYLLRAGLLDMTSRGRCLTKLAYGHLWPDMPIPPLLGLS